MPDRAALMREALLQEATQQQSEFAEWDAAERQHGLDTSTGVPQKVRLAVSLAKTPEDKLATLQGYPGFEKARWVQNPIPLAQAKEGQGETVSGGIPKAAPGGRKQATKGERRLAYLNPATGKPTLVNPEGLDMGDVTEQAVPAARTVAFAAGTAAGTALSGNPVAGLATGIAASQGTQEGADRLLGPALGVVDTRGGLSRAIDRGIDVGIETVTAGAGTLLPPGVKQVIRKAVGMPIKALKYKPSTFGRPEAVEAMDRQGIRMEGMLPYATESPALRQTFEAAGRNPNASERMAQAVEVSLGDARKAWTRAKATLGTAETAEEGGIAIKTGLEKGLAHRKGRIAGIEDRAMALYGLDQPVYMPRTAAWLQKQKAIYATGGEGAPRFPEDFESVSAALQNNKNAPQMEYVRRVLRGDVVGPKTSGGAVVPKDAAQDQYDELYRVMKEDLDAAFMGTRPPPAGGGGREMLNVGGVLEPADPRYAGTAGKPPPASAAKAWRESQALWEDWFHRRETLRSILNTPMYSTAATLALTGAAGGAQQLAIIKKSMPREYWNDFVAYHMGKIGEAPGQRGAAEFAEEKFIRQWSKLPKATKDVLYEPGSEARAALDDLEVIFRPALLPPAARFKNPSGTDQAHEGSAALKRGALLSILTGDLGALLGGGTKMADVKLTQAKIDRQVRLMTDPFFVRWAGTGKDLKPADYRSWTVHLSRLGAMAAKHTTMRDDYLGYMEDALDSLRNREPGPPAPQKGGGNKPPQEQ